MGGRENVAKFTNEYGFDPVVDLLFTTRMNLQRDLNVAAPSSDKPAEIEDFGSFSTLDGLDRITIQAQVIGPVSKLFDNLSLSSTPPRSQDELLSMVGGGSYAGLGGGEPLLALGSNTAGATLNNFQDGIGNALGLRRFRVGAARVLPTQDSTSLGYGVGASLDFTDALSLGVIQVINQTNQTQLNVEYQINNQIGVRSATDFSNDHRFFLEYRRRF